MLAVRPVEGVLSIKLFRQHLFWMFTLIGLTVPYRIWFSRHCDELRVTVAKETSADKPLSSRSWLKGPWSASASGESSEVFKAKMRELSLYSRGKGTILNTAKQKLLDKDKSNETNTSIIQQERFSTAIEKDGNNETLAEASVNITDAKVVDNGQREMASSLEQPLEGNTTTGEDKRASTTDMATKTDDNATREK